MDTILDFLSHYWAWIFILGLALILVHYARKMGARHTPSRSRVSRVILPEQSQREGIVVSAFIGLLGSSLLCLAMNIVFDSPLVSKIIFIPGWLALAYAYYKAFGFYVPPLSRAIRNVLGQPTATLYSDGYHHRFWPFETQPQIVPGPKQKFILEMPPMEPEGKDTVKSFIGLDVPARIDIRITEPLVYMGTDDPEHAVAGAYSTQVGQLIDHMNFGSGILEDKLLLERYLELPPRLGSFVYDQHPLSSDEKREIIAQYDAFAERLRKLKIRRRDDNNEVVELAVFDETSITSVLESGGKFAEELWESGLHMAMFFTPSVDQSPEVNAATAEKEAQHHRNELLVSKTDAFISQSERVMDKLKVSGEDAADRIGLMENQNISRKIVGLSGLLELGRELITLGVEALRDRPKSSGASSPQQPNP